MEIKNIVKKVKIGMAAAKTISQFSPDQQTKVGAVLMKKDSATKWSNGSPAIWTPLEDH